ncbi:MAG: DUF2330 domain-containing protein [Myxococcota bacterium]
MMRRHRSTFLCFAAPVLATAVWLSAPRAEACGGFFCDGGSTPMPVDQTGENILFVTDGAMVEAHIQIQYAGEPERFSWVIPVPSLPTFRVGSQPLFDNLLAGSVPTYGITTTGFRCDSSFSGSSGGAFSSASSSGGASSSSGGGGAQVVYRETVGVYDVTVLQGGSGQEVVTWLNDNGYQQDVEAPPILDEYVALNHLFVAVKLIRDAGSNELHPLVVRYLGDKPCVPLKLTAIASVENMGVRAFFLGQNRVVPERYKHVELNPLRVDWLNRGSNYRTVVNNAVNEAQGGLAFITEYAGPSSVVTTSFPSVAYSALWDSSVFQDAEPVNVVTLLQQQGLAGCDPFSGSVSSTSSGGSGGACLFRHPLLIGLLRRYVPAPEGVMEADFYGCLSCYAERIDQTAWNGAEFAAALQERIVEPGQHAQEILQQNPYLTRLFTTISPSEMVEDPMFHERTDLEDVATARNATREVLCNSEAAVTTPEGRVVWTNGFSWPQFDDDMPWTLRVEEFTENGPVTTIADNTEVVDAELDAWNTQNGYSLTSSGGATSSGGTDTSTSSGGGPFTPPGSDDDSGVPADGSTCACAIPVTDVPMGLAA